MKNVEAFVRPDTVEEILTAMQRPGALALAGGSTITLSKDPNVRLLVDLSGAPDLKAIKTDDTHLLLGPMVTMTHLIESDAVAFVALTQAARSVSSTPIRNQVTLGGEVARGVYWTDLPVALLALDATVKIANATTTRLMPMKELYTHHPSKVLEHDEIITQILVPRAPVKNAFIKFAKTNVDYALLSVAAGLTLGNMGTIETARIAFGAVTPLARRLPNVEEHLRGKAPSLPLFREAAERAVEELTYRSDFRVSPEYQREMVRVHTVRVLENALNAQ